VLISNAQAGATYFVRLPHKGNLVDNSAPTQITGQDLSPVLTSVNVAPAPELLVSSVVQTAPDAFTLFRPSVVGGAYDIETSTDLVTWGMAEDDISASKSLTGFEAPASGATKRFWRVQRMK